MAFGDAYMDRLQALWREELALMTVKPAVVTTANDKQPVMMATDYKDGYDIAFGHHENDGPLLEAQSPKSPLVHAPSARIMVFKRRSDARPTASHVFGGKL